LHSIARKSRSTSRETAATYRVLALGARDEGRCHSLWIANLTSTVQACQPSGLDLDYGVETLQSYACAHLVWHGGIPSM
jgi:hypothetical protein